MMPPDLPGADARHAVLVAGTGNAGLCAAIAAAQAGKRVIALEKAPLAQRGGNSALTMNFRFPHRQPEDLFSLIDDADRSDDQDAMLRHYYRPYTEDDFYQDLVATADGRCELALARTLADGAADTCRWLRALGHRWTYKQAANMVPGSVPVTIHGGGAGLQARHFALAGRLGVQIVYQASLQEIEHCGDDGMVVSVAIGDNGARYRLGARSLVLACGGFQANAQMRARHLGAAWRDVAIRGVPYNTGDGIRAALALGAARAGDWHACHATPQNAALAPHMLPGQNEESQANSRYLFNLGITVNQLGERFFDEGETLPNLLYAKVGRAILAQPRGIAYQLFDHATAALLPDGYFRGENMVAADSLAALAAQFGIDGQALARTVDQFNRHAHAHVSYGAPDGMGTAGLAIPKSHWARRLADPPWYLVPVRAGLTFTYGGVKIDRAARVVSTTGAPFPRLFSCGEMAGGLYGSGYAGGAGLMFGAHMGRIAGLHA